MLGQRKTPGGSIRGFGPAALNHQMLPVCEQWRASAEPPGLGPVVDVDTTAPVEVGALVDEIRRVLGH
jgi:hypothetical protein